MQNSSFDLTLQMIEQKNYSLQGSQSVQCHPLLRGYNKATYQKVLNYSRLQLYKEIGYRNVKIYEKQYIHEIYSIHNKKQSLPHLVLLHGYGGTSMTWIRMLKHFYKDYQIHAIDQFGIGYSSRGNYSEQFTGEQTRDYYINSIEQWRKSLQIQQFTLVGHSFGGYLSACYANKYPQRISKLILLSPVGLSKHFTKQESPQLKCKEKAYYCLVELVYKLKIRPTAAIKNFFIGNPMINTIVENRLKLQNKQKQQWKKYFYQFSSQQLSSETGFYKIFKWPLEPLWSIEEMINIKKPEFPIHFYFGDTDWMSRNGMQDLLKKFKNISLTIIPDSGHQLTFDNPEVVCRSMSEKMNIK